MIAQMKVDACGSSRVLAGANYPYVTEQFWYGNTFEAIRSSGLSIEAVGDVYENAAVKLYKL